MSDLTIQRGVDGEPHEEAFEKEVEVGDVLHVGPYEYLRISGKTTSREELITGVAGIIRDEGSHDVIQEIADEVIRQEEAADESR